MRLDEDTIRDQIPYYLTQGQKEGLLKALQSFPKGFPYYIGKYPTDVLQGDGWTQLEIVRFEDGARDKIKGVILSNSCDIDPANKTDMPTKATFAPLVKLSNYLGFLGANGIAKDQLDAKAEAIRAQKIWTIFYLPKGADLDDEYIALLDDVHTIPFASFAAEQNTKRTKLFTLSDAGFYLFILKLSIHFCRFSENVAR